MDKTKSRQTPGQARSRPGKIARKRAKKTWLQEEAGRRGITVPELLRQQSLEAEQIKQRGSAALATLGRVTNRGRRPFLTYDYD